MDNLKIGDVVARKSYGMDIYFKVVDIKENGGGKVCVLKGICYRIQADAPANDLVAVSENSLREHDLRFRMAVNRKCGEILQRTARKRGDLKKLVFRNTPNEKFRKFSRPGKILHVDGDKDYLNTCMAHYRQFGIEAVGKHVLEKDQPSVVCNLLEEYSPDILVLTGHDGIAKDDRDYLDVNKYRTSRYFIEGVRRARKYEKDMDTLVIFAGACQSMYDGLIGAGANFASSPSRVLIHALDPVFVCQKVAFTGIDTVLKPEAVIENTLSGEESIGGVETRGKLREGYPEEQFKGTNAVIS